MPLTQINEALTGTVDGANTIFTTSQVPEYGTLHVFVDMVEVAILTVVGSTITLAAAPGAGTQVFAVYNVKPDELTALDLISDALMEIGALAAGETPPPEDSDLALRYLNRLIASSNICRENIFTIRMDTFNLTVNKQSYTWGIDPAGVLAADINLPRPTRIQNIVLRLQTSPNVLRLPPMIRLTDREWADKPITSIFAIPLEFYNDGAFPFSTLYFYPGPGSAYQIELWTWQQGVTITAFTDPISYPPGYEDFWLYSLAERLCNPFQRPMTPQLQKQLVNASDRITSINITPPQLQTDPMLSRGRARGSWADGWMR